MRLVIESDKDGIVYAYRETEKAFRRNERERSKTSDRRKARDLDNDCHLCCSEHVVVKIKKGKK